jgi:hypothetical protein
MWSAAVTTRGGPNGRRSACCGQETTEKTISPHRKCFDGRTFDFHSRAMLSKGAVRQPVNPRYSLEAPAYVALTIFHIYGRALLRRQRADKENYDGTTCTR